MHLHNMFTALSPWAIHYNMFTARSPWATHYNIVFTALSPWAIHYIMFTALSPWAIHYNIMFTALSPWAIHYNIIFTALSPWAIHYNINHVHRPVTLWAIYTALSPYDLHHNIYIITFPSQRKTDSLLTTHISLFHLLRRDTPPDSPIVFCSCSHSQIVKDILIVLLRSEVRFNLVWYILYFIVSLSLSILVPPSNSTPLPL